VLNRGNNRATLFQRPADYAAFVRLIGEAQERVRLDLFAACVMPNHFHCVVRPSGTDDIGRWMHWLLTTHAARHHLAHGTVGRVWQGRYKAFPIEQGDHLVTVLRYVERNAVRANLVAHACDWKWGSASWRRGPKSRAALLAEPPVALPASWDDYVDAPQTPAEVEELRACVKRQQPYGTDSWMSAASECRGFRRPRPPGRRRAGK
jgi:putative transposase